MSSPTTELMSISPDHSTTRLVTRDLPVIERQPTDTFETVLSLPEGEGRQGEGGLRTQGYFKRSLPNKPLITVITVVYNGAAHLEETIFSVIGQTHDNVEYIIIDGGSTDGTLEIIRHYEHAIDYWVSEKDGGISDAFNKGVELSTGKYLNFQGDGDGFVKKSSLEELLDGINPENDILVSGRIQRISPVGKPLYLSQEIKKFHKSSLLFRMSLPHQALFTHITFFKKYGLFDTQNTYCMDYEHLLRAYKKFPKVITKNTVTALWRADGLGNGKTLQILKEYNNIKIKNKVANKATLKIINLFILLKFFIKKNLMERNHA